jgi:hypothetical protein
MNLKVVQYGVLKKKNTKYLLPLYIFQPPKNWTCFLLLKLSPNVLKFFTGPLNLKTFHHGVKKKIRQKALVHINTFFSTLKIEHVFYSSNSHQMLYPKRKSGGRGRGGTIASTCLKVIMTTFLHKNLDINRSWITNRK